MTSDRSLAQVRTLMRTVVTTIEPVVKRRLVEISGAISEGEQHDVDAALRAAQDL